MTGSGQSHVSGRRLDRRWLIAHLVSLIGVLAVLLWAGRGQWFFYDEWDFLKSDAEWALLAPHNGHLSLFPQLLTTLVKGMVGLHSYWPYLLLAFGAHLLVVHVLWRLMMRTDVRPVIALVVAVVFGVLAPGADNTLWAFQLGFMTPLATGIAAFLIARRDVLHSRDLIAISVLLLVGIGFASTGLPLAGAVILFVAVRHGWRSAVVPAVAFVVVYGAWYLAFARGTTGSDGFGARTLHDLLVRVPEFVAHALVDSVAQMIPIAAPAAALLVLIAVWIVLDLRRTGLRALSPAPYLVLAAIAFAVLTAVTRVQLGVENASAGRYVYVYGALLAPAAAAGFSALCGRSREAAVAVAVALTALAGYNAGGLVEAGRSQAGLEESVDRAMSAALTVDGRDEDLSNRTPSAVVAPTLTMADIRDFVRRGQYAPIAFEEGDLLSAEVNLLLRPSAVDGLTAAPETACAPGVGGWVAVDEDDELVYAPTGGNVRVQPVRDGAVGAHAQIALLPGWNRLAGLTRDIDLALAIEDAGGLCVVADDLASG